MSTAHRWLDGAVEMKESRSESFTFTNSTHTPACGLLKGLQTPAAAAAVGGKIGVPVIRNQLDQR